MNNYIKDALKAINERIPSSCSVEYKEVSKINGVKKNGFIFRESNSHIAPTFYLDDDEMNSIPPEEFADRVVKAYEQEKKRGMIDFNTDNFSNLEWIRKNIIFEIVNKDRNTDNMSCIAIPDTNLAITYKVRVNSNGFIRIKDEHLSMWNIQAEDLLKNAIDNSVLMDKATFRSMNDVILDMLVQDYKASHYGEDISDDEIRQHLRERMFSSFDNIFVLSTEIYQSNSSLLYPNLLSEIKHKLNEAVYIIPSSRHETLIVKESDANDIGISSLRDIVRSVNAGTVGAEDFLSDEIYYFDGRLRQVDEKDINEFAV